LDGESVIVDEGIGPEGGEEFVAAADGAGALGEVGEEVEGLGREDDFGGSAPETAKVDIQSELAEV
jgi:hypothetical protein